MTAVVAIMWSARAADLPWPASTPIDAALMDIAKNSSFVPDQRNRRGNERISRLDMNS
jgi:hypothetical protein